MLWTWMALAMAGELNFSPDRPGVGNSTGTVGVGHMMVEGGVAATVDQPSAVGTSGITGRVGIDDGVELRVRVPDITVAGGEVYSGSVGVGAKFGGSVSERWSVTVAPELAVDTNGGGAFGIINANLALALGDVGLWATSDTAVDGNGASASAGGGVGIGLGGGGIYVNGGGQFGGTPFIGGGGWWSLGDAAQLDAGCDVYVANGEAIPVFLLGGSVGF